MSAPAPGAALPASPDAVCTPRARAQAHAYAANAMSRALYRAAGAAPLREQTRMELRPGRFGYAIERGVYTVSDGGAAIRAALEYAFGQGAADQTYAYQHQGRRDESRVSYYSDIGKPDLTMGASPGEPKTLLEAAGREMTAHDVTACFGCHTTGSIRDGAPDFERLQPDSGGEHCHGAAARHVRAFRTGNIEDGVLPKLGQVSTEEQSGFCGRRHRRRADIAAHRPRGVGSVRFQRYRLADSKCYDAAGRRISCTACHDAHGPLEHRLAAYDGNGKACHAAAGKARTCAKAMEDRTRCRMPRYEIPGSHHLFTDHQIRIVRAHETYPN